MPATQRRATAIIVAAGLIASGATAIVTANDKTTLAPQAAAQPTALHACLNLSTGRLEVGSAGGNIIRAYVPRCPSSADLVVSWTLKTPTPTTTSTSTTVPTSTVPTTVPSSSAPPPRGGYFQLSAPGTPLPSDETCATQVHRSSWEPRPENAVANRTLPITTGPALGFFSSYTTAWNNTYKQRILGNASTFGMTTTDEIIQYEACRWGLSDETIRGEAVQESSWQQSATGDSEARSRGHCPYDVFTDPCFTSYGLMQSKWYYEPENQTSGTPGSGYPSTKLSTAFIVDLYGAQMRGCYEGMSAYLGNTRGNMPGCIGSWYSGGWDPTGGSYYASVQNHIAGQEWLSYRPSAHNAATPAARARANS